MEILIFNGGKSETLHFDNAEEFNNFRKQIRDCIADETNTRSLVYIKNGVERIYPSLAVKASIIEIVEKKDKVFVF